MIFYRFYLPLDGTLKKNYFYFFLFYYLFIFFKTLEMEFDGNDFLCMVEGGDVDEKQINRIIKKETMSCRTQVVP